MRRCLAALLLVVCVIHSSPCYPSGPLSREAVVELLRSDALRDRVVEMARSYGLGFPLTPENEEELRAAGLTAAQLQQIWAALAVQAAATLRELNVAALTYRNTYQGYPRSPEVLGWGPGAVNPRPSAQAAQLVGFPLQPASYVFEYQASAANGAGPVTSYTITARPVAWHDGLRNFFTDASAVIRSTREERLATEADSADRQSGAFPPPVPMAAGQRGMLQPAAATAAAAATPKAAPADPCSLPTLWANFVPGTQPEPSKGGWRIGGGERDGNEGVAIGSAFLPACSGKVSRIEIVAAEEGGEHPLLGYVMSDANQPGTVLDSFTFSPPKGSAGALIAASTATHALLNAGQRYWFVLAAPDPLHDSFFWYRNSNPLEGNIARRVGMSAWQVYGAYVGMLRICGDDIAPGAPYSPGSPASAPTSPVYTVGPSITPPIPLYKPDPSYTDDARKAKVSGEGTLWVVVGTDGSVQDLGILRSLRLDLDQSAIETLKTWRFQPATKDGAPVPVRLNVAVNFRLR